MSPGHHGRRPGFLRADVFENLPRGSALALAGLAHHRSVRSEALGVGLGASQGF